MAAATFYWRGLAPTNKDRWDEDANWVNSSGVPYSGDRYPGSSMGDNDTAIFDQALGVGAGSPAGYDGSGDEMLALLKVGPQFNGTIGSASVPLKHTFTSVQIAGNKAKGIYLFGAPTNPGKIEVSHAGEDMELNGEWGGAASFFFGKRILLKSSIEFLSLYCGSVGNIASDVVLTAENGANLSTGGDMVIDGGQITFNGPQGGTLMVRGGSVTLNAGANGPIEISGGNVIWIAGDLSSNVQISAGKLDASGGRTARTYGKIYLYEKGFLDIDNGLRNILKSGSSDGIFWHRGQIKAPVGSLVVVN